MKIKSIQIKGFRKIKDATINMEDNLTIIAGANNSGKTSIIELLQHVFNTKKEFTSDDFPALNCKNWRNTVFADLQAKRLLSFDKEEMIGIMSEVIAEHAGKDDENSLAPIEVKIQVDYDPAKDDIRRFADYIMELDPAINSFFFIFRFELDQDRLRKNLESHYDRIAFRFKNLTGDAAKDRGTARSIKNILLQLYSDSCKTNTYYADKAYVNAVLMERDAFMELFNYQNIMAGRTLDDNSTDKSKQLSRNIIDIASQEDKWKTLIRSLPDKLLKTSDVDKIQNEVRSTSIEALGKTIDEISKTNGTHPGSIAIDIDITEDNIQSFLKMVTSAKYQIEDFFLKESSQGLGYSNLIFIHLQLEKFRKTIKENQDRVNFFVIEEPEAHMHPQMQNVFAQYLSKYFQKESFLQGLVTTHSHEVVRTHKISNLRVLRQTEPFSCSLYDLREFITSLKEQKKQDIISFYDWFYTINFPDIVFADKVILYEGDTERMLIRNVLNLEPFSSLQNQYISFVQVGGAYAFKYKPILDYLKIKALIITDLDYKKEEVNESKVLNTQITNATIKKLAQEKKGWSNPTVQELYDWQNAEDPIVIGDHICLAFQGEKEHFARTLEEAMIARLTDKTAVQNLTHKEWKEKLKKLKSFLPREKETSSYNIRTIVSHLSHRKTDFMYSVIIEKLVDKMLPDYIREGLKWLAQ